VEKIMDRFALNFDSEIKKRQRVFELLRRAARDSEYLFSPRMVPIAELEEKETQISNCWLKR